MEPVAREIRFDPAVLEAAERHAEGDLSAFVNAAVRRAIPQDDPPATAAECRAAFAAALDARDPQRARAVIEQAILCGVPAVDVYIDVLAPILHEIGHRWAVQEISVAHEHFVTGVVQGVLPLIAAQRTRAPTGGRLAVAACTPGELHGIALQMVADLLARQGWEVITLGPATPAEDLAALVESECADLVALSTSTAGRLPGLADTLQRLGDVSPRPLVAVGGGLFTPAAASEARALGADLVESDLRAFLAAVREHFPPD